MIDGHREVKIILTLSVLLNWSCNAHFAIAFVRRKISQENNLWKMLVRWQRMAIRRSLGFAHSTHTFITSGITKIIGAMAVYVSLRMHLTIKALWVVCMT